MVEKIVIASRNRDKAREIRKILGNTELKVLTLDDYRGIPNVVEDGKTFEHNAAKKARIVSRYTGTLTIADDSGLEVDFLNGRPGVKSARFAGIGADYKANNVKLLRLLQTAPPSKRKARFVCVIAIAKEGKLLHIIKGTCRGKIAFSPRGRKGFGYDPLFIPMGYDRTFSELGPAIKDRISHRYRALRKTKTVIKRLLKEV